MLPNINRDVAHESIRPSKRRKTSAAALLQPLASNHIQPLTTPDNNVVPRRPRKKENERRHVKFAQLIGTPSCTEGPRRSISEPVAEVRQSQRVPKIGDIDLTDPAASTERSKSIEPTEPRESEEAEEAEEAEEVGGEIGEEIGEEVEQEVEEEVEDNGEEEAEADEEAEAATTIYHVHGLQID